MASILQTNNIFDSRFPSPHAFERPHTRRSVTNADNLQPFGWNDVNNIWRSKPQILPDEQVDESERVLAPPVRNGIPTFTSQDVRPVQYPGHWKQNGQSANLAGNHGSIISPVRSRNDSTSAVPTSLSLSKSGLLSESNPDIDPLHQTVPRKQSLGHPFPNNPWQRIREFQPLSTIQNVQSSSYAVPGNGQLRTSNGVVPGQAPFVNGMLNAANGGDHEIPQYRSQRTMSSDLRPASSSSLSYHSMSNGQVIGRDEGNSVYSADFLSPAMENLNLNYTNGQGIDDGNRHTGLTTYQIHSRHGMRPNKAVQTGLVKGSQNSPANGFAQQAFEHQYPFGSSRNGYASLKDPGLSSANDFRNKVHTPYFSATGTPTVGSESRRSNSASGSSTRGSHPQASTLEQRLKTLEPQSDGFLLQTPSYQEYLGFNNQYEYGLSNPAVRHGSFPEQFANNNHLIRSYGNELVAVNRPTDSSQIVRSPLLEDFRMNSKTQRYELKDIYNHVVEFSGDQHGSRFIQQKLETANSDEKDQIFSEIACDSLQLMTDVFGNYVIQKMFEHGNQSQKKVLANYMKGHVFTLSMQMYGCRVVQKALEHILTDQQASLIKELDGVVLKVVENQNGNHVIQKAIERVPGEHIQFIVDAHRGHVYELSKHAYGCRVIQRMLEYCQPHAKRVILDELQQNIGLLIKDSFGNYVVQHVIVNGELRDRKPVIDMVQADLLANSKHKFASNVVEKAIDYAEEEQRQAILQQLTTGRDKYGQSYVTDLLKDQYGNYVIQKCLSHLKGAALQSLIYEVEQYLTQLRRVSSGKQVGALETSIKDARQRVEVARIGNGLHMNNSRW